MPRRSSARSFRIFVSMAPRRNPFHQLWEALMAVAPVNPASSAAFGLDFQSMLKIILTQLTYQDPLKPLDNFQFVSQLGQFAQLQQSQSLNDQITTLLTAQSSLQATGLLGKTVD